jgi:hypothetical protein
MPKPHRPTQAPTPDDRPHEAEHDSLLFLVTRLYWTGLGPIFALMLLVGVAQNATGWFTTTDAVYFAAVGLLGLSRWLEFRMGKAETTAGKTATWNDLTKYLIVVALLALLAWIVAKVIGLYLLAG